MNIIIIFIKSRRATGISQNRRETLPRKRKHKRWVAVLPPNHRRLPNEQPQVPPQRPPIRLDRYHNVILTWRLVAVLPDGSWWNYGPTSCRKRRKISVPCVPVKRDTGLPILRSIVSFQDLCVRCAVCVRWYIYMCLSVCWKNGISQWEAAAEVEAEAIHIISTFDDRERKRRQEMSTKSVLFHHTYMRTIKITSSLVSCFSCLVSLSSIIYFLQSNPLITIIIGWWFH